MKGQISIEFLMFISILTVIALLFLWNNFSLNYKMIDIKSKIEAKKFCDEIAFEINAAVKAGNGYERNFYMENNFFGASDFDIYVRNYSVSIDWDKGSATCKIITKNTTGTISTGWNHIKNINGEIIVS